MDVYVQVHILDRRFKFASKNLFMVFLKESANCLDWVFINGI